MTDTLMWQVHPPLVQPSSSQVRDIGIVENPCPTEHGRDWTQLWPGVVHNLCTWVHLRNRGSGQGRDETTKLCRFNAFSGREKTLQKSGGNSARGGTWKDQTANEWQESALINFLMQKPFSANNHWNIYGLHVFKSRNDLKYGGCLGVSHFNKFEMRRRDTSIFDCSGFIGTGLRFPKWRTQCNTHRVGVLESWVVVWPDATSCSKKNP